jgi:2-C-methyl-D-erythritol 2,4-cyclodiphosphate synthase
MGQPTRYKPTVFRSGIGYDVHPLVKGRKLVLGGVTVPYEKGLKGHSDADVLLHAVSDAVLGAAGQGDIGMHFPDTDQRYKGISSLRLLVQVRKVIERAGFKVSNIDCVLLAEAPKIGPYRRKMCRNIAKALDVGFDRVNVKATTNEGLGFIGRKEGMAAYATATLHSLEH